MILRRVAAVLLVVYGVCLSIYGQESGKKEVKPFLVDEIRSRLYLRPKIKQSDESFNKKLIAEIKNRKVDFLLSADEEKEFRKLGANNGLIKAIKSGVPPRRLQRLRLYAKLNIPYLRFTSNYRKRTIDEIKTAIQAGKEFLELAGDDPEFKPQVDFVKAFVPRLEKRIQISY